MPVVNLRDIRIVKYKCSPRLTGATYLALGTAYAAAFYFLDFAEFMNTTRKLVINGLLVALFVGSGIWNLLFRHSLIECEVRLGTWREKAFRLNKWLFLLLEAVQCAALAVLIPMLCMAIDDEPEQITGDGFRTFRLAAYLFMAFSFGFVREWLSLYQYFHGTRAVSPRVYRPRRWTLNNIIRYRFW